jgi:hypothetical protein
MSKEIFQLEYLLNRIPPNHPQKEEISNHLGRIQAGYFGESTADHYLKYIEGTVLRDLRLHDGIQAFQIDTLLVTEKFLSILEVKNYKGELIFDFTNRRILRNVEGKTDFFPDPFIQVELQKVQLRRWMSKLDLPYIPLHPFIVIAHPQASLSFLGNDEDSKRNDVFLVKQLPSLLREFIDEYKGDVVWSKEQINLFTNKVRAELKPYEVNVMKKFGITKTEHPRCSVSYLQRFWYGTKA